MFAKRHDHHHRARTPRRFVVRSCLAIASALVFGLGQGAPAMASSTAVNNVPADFIGLAQSKLNAEYSVLVTGDRSPLLNLGHTLRGAAAQGVPEAADNLVRRHVGLAQHGLHYVNYSSSLRVVKLAVSRTDVELVAQEDVTLTLLDQFEPEPIYTRESKSHVFRFSQDEPGRWGVIEDRLPQELPRRPALPGEPKLSDSQRPIDIGGLERPRQTPNAGSRTSANIALSGTFNSTSAVNYARTYWHDYNSAYRHYDNDCTSFVSQALNWAGWQHVGGMYYDANNWWYSPGSILPWGNKAESSSWIKTNHFYWFARYSGRGHDAAYLSDFRPGDVLQIDQSVPDGYLEHTEIVTAKDSAGNIFLTSHSIDVLDKPFWDIYYQYPGANFYGTIMNYSY